MIDYLTIRRRGRSRGPARTVQRRTVITATVSNPAVEHASCCSCFKRKQLKQTRSVRMGDERAASCSRKLSDDDCRPSSSHRSLARRPPPRGGWGSTNAVRARPAARCSQSICGGSPHPPASPFAPLTCAPAQLAAAAVYLPAGGFQFAARRQLPPLIASLERTRPARPRLTCRLDCVCCHTTAQVPQQTAGRKGESLCKGNGGRGWSCTLRGRAQGGDCGWWLDALEALRRCAATRC
jgi:hypothetical protein